MSRIPQPSRVMKKSSRKSSRKLNPPSIKRARKKAIKKHRQDNPFPVMSSGLARMLEFPEGPNRRLVL